jgi:hypothetical protein
MGLAYPTFEMGITHETSTPAKLLKCLILPPGAKLVISAQLLKAGRVRFSSGECRKTKAVRLTISRFLAV